jgi:outer membrane protein TolC
LENGSVVDRLRWEEERHQVTADVVRAREDVAAAKILLNVLFNLPGASPLEADATELSLPRFWTEYDYFLTRFSIDTMQAHLEDFLVEQALTNNPTALTQQIKIELQKDLLGRNTARYLPSLDFDAFYNLIDQLKDNPPTFKEEHSTWSVWGGLRWPIFQGADRIYERAKLKAELSQYEFERDNVRLAVMGRVRSLMRTMMGTLYAAPRTIRSAELATQQLSLTGDLYENGDRDLVDMLDAYTNARSAELDAILDRHEFYLHLATLVHQVGWPLTRSNTFRDEFYRHVTEQFRN